MSKPAIVYDAHGTPVGAQRPGRPSYFMPGDVPADLACKRCNGEGRVAIVLTFAADGQEVLRRECVGGYATYFNAMLRRADGEKDWKSPVFEPEDCRTCSRTGINPLLQGKLT